jgi:hypothetical protein
VVEALEDVAAVGGQLFGVGHALAKLLTREALDTLTTDLSTSTARRSNTPPARRALALVLFDPVFRCQHVP